MKTDTKTDENGKETESRNRDPLLKAFVVFNIAQTDYQEKGYQLPDLKDNPHLLGCDALFRTTRAESIRIAAGDRRIFPRTGYHHLPGDRPVQELRALLCDDVP